MTRKIILRAKRQNHNLGGVAAINGKNQIALKRAMTLPHEADNQLVLRKNANQGVIIVERKIFRIGKKPVKVNRIN